jgi:hypothetical protein
MNKLPSNVYEKQKVYNDILLNNNSKNLTINNKNLMKKLNETKPNELKNASVSVTNTGNNPSTNSNNSNSKTNQTEIQSAENPKYKSDETKQDTTTEQKGKTETKPQKPKTERIKLDEKTLFYSENGLKKFYEIISQNSFKENRSEVTSII